MNKNFGATLKKVYSGDFDIYSADNFQNSFVLACGDDGVHFIDNNTYRFLECMKTVGKAYDMKAHGYRIYVAEGTDGVEIFEVYGILYKKITTFNPGKDIIELEINDDGRYMKCICRNGGVVYADISNEPEIKEVSASVVSDDMFRSELIPYKSIIAEYPGVCRVNMHVFISCDTEKGIVTIIDVSNNKVLAQLYPDSKIIKPVLFDKRNLLLTEDGFYEILFDELVILASQL